MVVDTAKALFWAVTIVLLLIVAYASFWILVVIVITAILYFAIKAVQSDDSEDQYYY